MQPWSSKRHQKALQRSTSEHAPDSQALSSAQERCWPGTSRVVPSLICGRLQSSVEPCDTRTSVEQKKQGCPSVSEKRPTLCQLALRVAAHAPATQAGQNCRHCDSGPRSQSGTCRCKRHVSEKHRAACTSMWELTRPRCVGETSGPPWRPTGLLWKRMPAAGTALFLLPRDTPEAGVRYLHCRLHAHVALENWSNRWQRYAGWAQSHPDCALWCPRNQTCLEDLLPAINLEQASFWSAIARNNVAETYVAVFGRKKWRI